MNLFSLEIPSKYESLLITYEHYFHSFYLEMVRMSNAMLSKHLDLFLSKLVQISKTINEANQLRTSIGVVSLHNFGYRNFELLTKIFDRILPQSNPEYIKFTSWCAGQLVCHPNLAKSRYVQHLFDRSIGWIRHKGKYGRPLAACYLIASLSIHDGSTVVASATSFQTVIWLLIAHKSAKLIQATAYAFSRFTFAITNYGRSEMDSFFHFFIQLCKSLLTFGSTVKKYAALCLIKELILNNSEYFFSDFQFLYDSFSDILNNSKNLLAVTAAYQAMAHLSIVDSKQFVSTVSNILFTKMDRIKDDFPNEVVDSLSFVIRKVPEFMETKIEELKNIAKSLISHPHVAFSLLHMIMKSFGSKALPFESDFIQTLMDLPCSPEYRDFFISFTNCPNSFGPDFPTKITQRLLKELETESPVAAIELLAQLPQDAFVSQPLFLKALTGIKSSKFVEVRAAIPKAVFHLGETCKSIDTKNIIRQLMQYAMYDSSTIVRCSVLRVFLEKANDFLELAEPEYLKFFQVYSNEDSQSARNLAFDLIAKIGKNNPMFFASITRNSLLDYFFTLRHVSSIRQRARITRTLPCLIKASLITISSYSKAFMDIALDVLKNRQMKESFENFLEEDANVAIISGILDSLSLISPIQPDLISAHGNALIPLLCDFLLETEERKITLSIVNFFEVIFTPPSYSSVYRTMAPMIISACSSLLSQTNSWNFRIAILRVFGVIGVIEPNEIPLSKVQKLPSDFDNPITRRFFLPSRDSEISDDYVSVKKEELYVSIVLKGLLKIIKDDHLKEYYLETVQCFVVVFSKIFMDMLSYFDAFMNRFLTILEASNDTELSNYLPLLTKLVKNAQNNVTPFLSKLLSLITTRFNDFLAMMIYDLILALLDSVRDNFSHYASELICLLICLIDTVKTTDEIQSKKILLAFSKICVYANDLLYLIIPQICDAILCEQTLDNVRILSFYCLESIAKSTDLFDYIGPIVRAMNIGLEHENEDTRNSAMQLLYVIIKTQGKRFLDDADIMLSLVNKNNLETVELKKIIEKVNKSKSFGFQPLIENEPLRTNVSEKQLIFSEDTIVSRVFMQNIGTGYNLEHWFHSFIFTTISNAPLQAIRTCSTLVAAYSPLAHHLFPAAFLNCWLKINERGRTRICSSFMQLLSSNENYETVAREIINLFVYLHHYGETLPVDTHQLIKACLRYGKVSFALKLISEILDKMKNPDSNIITTLIEAYTQASQWSNALHICDKYQTQSKLISLDNLMKLKKWTVAEKIFKKQLEENDDLNAFRGISECLASQAKWDQLLSYYSIFKEKMPRDLQRDVSEFFALAAFNARKWDILTDVLKYAPKSSIQCTILAAVNCIHSQNYDKVDDYINHGFELLASKPLGFWTGGHRVHTETMISCQELMEIREIMRWMKGENRREIKDVWKQRLITAPPDFSLWFRLIGLKVPLGIDLSDILIKFFLLRSTTLDVTLHRNVFNSIFPEFSINELNNNPDTDQSIFCNSAVLWMTGQKQESINSVRSLLENGSLKDKDSENHCRLLFVIWLLEKDDSLDANLLAYQYLSPVISSLNLDEYKVRIPKYKPSAEKYENNSLPNNVQKSLYTSTRKFRALRKWSEINISLTTLDPSHLTDYVTNAIDALTKCASIAPSFPDVVQLLNLFFENAHQPAIFNSTAHSCIEKLHPKLILQAAPQLLIQLSHSTPEVANFVHDLVFGILREHFHAFIFSIIVLKSSKNTARAKSAKKLYDEFQLHNPQAFEEVELIRRTLLRAAVTWNESIIQRITDAFDHLSMNRIDRMVASLRYISQFVKKPKCEMHEHLKRKYERQFTQLDNILRSFDTTSKPNKKTKVTTFQLMNGSSSSSNSNSNELNQKVSPLVEWCKMMNSLLTDDVKHVRTIELSAISSQLAQKTHFILAVPGTYFPNKPIIHIEYFIGQVSVYLSKQQPKDIVIVGDNGIYYQYLLKGHEDLRLDERIMQFFSTINSILKKSNNFRGQLIEAMFVMPISISHGLVQWVNGTHTLRAIVESYRNSQGREPLEEYVKLDQLSYLNFDFLQPIQKLQIIEKIFEEVPDTDISNIFWMKSKSSEEWLKKTINFTVSTAMMSITGYTIGLGDRHPSNILVDKNSGKLIHIDFGDCFERAAKREFLPEVVPFRLTRMIVKAMGITGTNGLFKHSFINMSYLLRENKKVLVMVLAIFVHEPLADPENNDDQTSEMEGLRCQTKKILSKATTGSVTDKGRVYMLGSSDQNQLSSVEMSNRVNQKLSGTDFDNEIPLTVEEQAIRLIETATDRFNLAMMYSGWCPFW